jgi:DNA polymerase III gamma and tau subunits C terminal.
LSKKEKEIIKKKQLLESIKNEKIYLKVLEAFPDAELIDIEVNTKQNDND